MAEQDKPQAKPQMPDVRGAVVDFSALAEMARVARAQEDAKVAERVADLRANRPEGGRYIVDGQMVDANGNPVKDKKD